MSSVPADALRRSAPSLTLAEMVALIPAQPPRAVSENAPRKLTLDEMRRSLASSNTSDKRTSVSANQPQFTTSDNPRPSRAYGEGDVQALVAELIAARAARGHRKAIRKPFRRRGQRDLFDVVRLHLRRLSRRVLNDRCRGGLEPPSEPLLTEALEDYVRQQLSTLIYHHEYGEQREPNRVRRTYLDESRNAVERVARSCARHRGQPTGGRAVRSRRAWGGAACARYLTWPAAVVRAIAGSERG